jgi:hypothetical protein
MLSKEENVENGINRWAAIFSTGKLRLLSMNRKLLSLIGVILSIVSAFGKKFSTGAWDQASMFIKKIKRVKIIFFKNAALLPNLHKFVETAYLKWARPIEAGMFIYLCFQWPIK